MRRSSGANSQFKPPKITPKSVTTTTEQEHGPTATTAEQLLIEKNDLEAQIKLLEDDGHRVEELEDYVTILHDYNNVKDIAQCIMGRLANLRGVTVREVSEGYDAPKEDVRG